MDVGFRAYYHGDVPNDVGTSFPGSSISSLFCYAGSVEKGVVIWSPL